MNRIVIDACVWNHWHNMSVDDMDSVVVINNFIEGYLDELLCLDCDGVIAQECSKNTSGDFYRVVNMEKCWDRIVYLDSTLESEIRTKLKNELGFHQDTDLCYVGVALNADKVIISLDGDYGLYPDEYYRSQQDAEIKHAVAEYMRKDLGLKVYTSQMYVTEYHKT